MSDKTLDSLKRLLAGTLCAALLIVSPGVSCYQALGAELASDASVEAPGTSGLAPVSLGAMDLNAQMPPSGAAGLSAGLSGAALPTIPSDLTAPTAARAVESAPRFGLKSTRSASKIRTKSEKGLASAVEQSVAAVPVEAALTGESAAAVPAGKSATRRGPAAYGALKAAAEDAGEGRASLDSGRASPEAMVQEGNRIFDRSAGRGASVSAWSRGLKSLRAGFAAAVVAGGLLLAPAGLHAAPALTRPAAVVTAGAPSAGQVGVSVPQPREPAPASVHVSFDRQNVTVGDRVEVTLTLKNATSQSLTISELPQAVKSLLPQGV
ncbi:MAG: hypothetical protein KGI84_09810, partial [Elusimicrobia bacterium]|nr:hypothetical protein [Elusimicrobiota bacterium]